MFMYRKSILRCDINHRGSKKILEISFLGDQLFSYLGEREGCYFCSDRFLSCVSVPIQIFFFYFNQNLEKDMLGKCVGC
jgi:hypothetical protein